MRYRRDTAVLRKNRVTETTVSGHYTCPGIVT